MAFKEEIKKIEGALKSVGTKIDLDSYDGIIVKKLESSNTLDDGRKTNQTHIAITGEQMDIFPYLCSDGYFNDKNPDTKLKKYFITQVPVNIYESNVKYLESQGSYGGITFVNGLRKSETSIVRSRRKTQADQIQLSFINFDGQDFISFRKLLHEGAYLIVLKKKCCFEYDFFGLLPSQNTNVSIQSMNNKFFKDETNTVVNVGNMKGTIIDEKQRKNGGSNILLYGVPGSGKSWTIAHEYCEKDTNVERLVFYPDYTYSDFVGQILPNVSKDGQVSYKFTPGPFTKVLAEAYVNPQEEYILIIEEINRGNAPAIFGGIFQLLDRKTESCGAADVYPIGTSAYGIANADIATIVYGDANHEVRIPSNLSIIATMNTSDQNVFTLDTAFQRRWEMRLIENNFEHVDKRLAEAQILDTSITWETFCTQINKIIVEENVMAPSAEDKRLGVYFVQLKDLEFDSKMGDLSSGEYDGLLTKEQNNTITGVEKERLSEIRAAMKQNRKFPEKVIKYLWDDALKFNREAIFDTTEYNSLEQIIRAFMYAKPKERFCIFKDNIRNELSSIDN